MTWYNNNFMQPPAAPYQTPFNQPQRYHGQAPPPYSAAPVNPYGTVRPVVPGQYQAGHISARSVEQSALQQPPTGNGASEKTNGSRKLSTPHVCASRMKFDKPEKQAAYEALCHVIFTRRQTRNRECVCGGVGEDVAKETVELYRKNDKKGAVAKFCHRAVRNVSQNKIRKRNPRLKCATRRRITR
jgi:hypothetical protein